MKLITRKWLRSIVMLIVAVAVPLSLVSLIVVLDHLDLISTSMLVALPWQLNVAALALPGLIPISYLRWPLEWRIVAGLIHFLAMFAIVPIYGLVFSCMFTGDCL